MSCNVLVQSTMRRLLVRAPARQPRGTPSGYAEASRGFLRLSRLTCRTRIVLRLGCVTILAALGSLVSVGLLRPAAGAEVTAAFRIEVVVTGIPRPVQLAHAGDGMLVVLGHGWRGDAAAELYRIDLGHSLPVDAARAPRVVIPFASEPRKTVLGSLAVDTRTGDLYVGEENGNRIYRLEADQRLRTVVVGLNHLLGGSAIDVDQHGRLVFLDYASPEMHLRSETPLPPSLSWLTEEGYRGPEVFRVDIHEPRPLPRRADLLSPILPRSEATGAGKEPMWRLIAVTASGDDLVLLSAVGEVFRLGPDGELRHVARLPAGHYHRTNMAVGPDGSVFVCGGFQIRRIFRISPSGEVSVVASELGDPGGIVLDREGALYVAETALHRIIRISPAGRR